MACPLNKCLTFPNFISNFNYIVQIYCYYFFAIKILLRNYPWQKTVANKQKQEKLMKKAKTIILLLMVVIFSTGIGFTTDKTYVVGVENLDYFPFYSGAKKDSYGGFAREFLDAFAKAEGYKFTYKALPIKRLFNDFLKEKIDFKFPDNSYWQSDLKKGINIAYSKSVVNYIDGAMVLPENKGKGIESLKTLGTVMGFTAWDYLDLIKSNKVKIIENPSFKGLLKQAIEKRINGAYINPAVARYQLENVMNKPNALVFDPNLPHTKSSYMLSTIKHPEIIEKLNIFMEQNKQAIEEMKNKYKVTIAN